MQATSQVAPEKAIRALQAALPPPPSRKPEAVELSNVAPGLLLPPSDSAGLLSELAGGVFELGNRIAFLGRCEATYVHLGPFPKLGRMHSFLDRFSNTWVLSGASSWIAYLGMDGKYYSPEKCRPTRIKSCRQGNVQHSCSSAENSYLDKAVPLVQGSFDIMQHKDTPHSTAATCVCKGLYLC